MTQQLTEALQIKRFYVGHQNMYNGIYDSDDLYDFWGCMYVGSFPLKVQVHLQSTLALYESLYKVWS